MKFSTRDLLLVTVIVALAAGALTANADDLNQIELTIEGDSPQESTPWLRQELARAAIAHKDFARCDSAIHRIKERSERTQAVWRACEVAARVLDDTAISQLASDMPSWQNVKEEDGQKNAVETLVSCLCEAGRCALASEIGKAAKLAPTLEVKIFRGDLEGAKLDLGAPANRQRAVLAAARAYRSGAHDNVIDLLKDRFPNDQQHWSRDLCLELSAGGFKADKLTYLCPSDVRRKALERACRMLEDLESAQLQSFKDPDALVFAKITTESESDLMSSARACAVFREQGEKVMFDICASRALSQCRPPEKKGRVEAASRARIHGALLKEIAAGRIRFGQFRELEQDLTSVKAVFGQSGTLAVVVDALIREKRQGTKVNVDEATRALTLSEFRIAARLGAMEADYEMPPEVTSWGDLMRETLRYSLFTRLQDELYE